MAIKTLVTSPPPIARQLIRFLEAVSEQNGEFVLAMLVPSETGLSDRWNLVLSAPWIDRDGLAATIPALTTLLLRHLSGSSAHKLERVSVLPTIDPLVTTMAASPVPLGEVHRFQFFPQAEGALVLRAGAPALRHQNGRPVSVRA